MRGAASGGRSARASEPPEEDPSTSEPRMRDAGRAASLKDGDECERDRDCESDHCDNGVCCAGGECCERSADCPAGGQMGAICDDHRTCQGTRGEVVCERSQCTTREGVPDDTACGATIEADECGTFPSVFCSGTLDQSEPQCATSCQSDGDCDPGAHCDTVCVANSPDGERCDEASDCASQHCSGGVCCQGGDCCSTARDCPVNSLPGICNSIPTCQSTRTEVQCVDFMCSETRYEDDSACSTALRAATCGLYADLYCNGGVLQTARCKTACTGNNDADCDENAHCEQGACVADRPDGQRCTEDSDCQGACNTAVCCRGVYCCQSNADCPQDLVPDCDVSRFVCMREEAE
jgi:hypothetical protein